MTERDQNIPELITAFVDGELSGAEANKVQQHMDGDPNASRLATTEQAIKHALVAKISRAVPPPGFEQRLRAHVFGDHQAAPAASTASRPFWRLLTSSPAFATTAGALVLVAVLLFVVVAFRGDRVSPYVRDVYAHHVQVERFPITIQADGNHDEVAQKASALVGFNVSVPRLGDQYTLRGARKCILCDQLIAFIKYDNETDGLISFFIIPTGKPAIWRLDKHNQDAMTFYTADHQDVRMAFWRDKGVTYCVAAQAPEDRVLSLASTACRQVRDTSTRLTAPRPATHPGGPHLATVHDGG